MKKLMILLIVVVVVSIFVWYAVGRKEGEGSYGPELPASAPAQKMDPQKTAIHLQHSLTIRPKRQNPTL